MDSSGSQEKKNIPRFASFKPRPAPPPEADRPPGRPSRDISDREEKSSHRSRHRSRHRSHHDRSRSRERRRGHREHRSSRNEGSHRRREPTSESPRPSTSTRTRTVKHPPDEASDLYVIDSKGDRYNLIYGTIHRYSVPQYYRVGRGNVLGLPSSYKIDRESAVEDVLVVTNEHKGGKSKKKAKNLLAGLDKGRSRLLRIRPESLVDAAADTLLDYIPLSVSSKGNRLDLLEVDSDDEKHAYRSIHGKAKPEDDLPSDVEAVSGTDSDREGGRSDPDQEIKQRNAELLRNVEKSPDDISAWLTLIDHQESLLRGSERESGSLTYAEKMGLADIKLSLYEKALKKVGSSPAKDRLLLGLLEEGAKLWDTKKLSAQWQTILKSNSEYISLWIRYLDFRQTEFLGFTYERCFATFLECLRLNKFSLEKPEKTRVHLYLFLRLTLFIREAGFTEHAAALWQGLLELTFYRPDSLDGSKSSEEVIQAFLEFWESEVSRVGEAGAKGWKNDENVLQNASYSEKPGFQLNSGAVFASWAPCEKERTVNARLPARSIDDSEEDDPYRVIIASDLEEILSLAWQATPAEVLINSFFHYCHLPPIPSVENLGTTSRWNGDGFVRNEFASSFYTTLADWLPDVAAGIEPTVTSPVLFPHHNFIITLDTLFADPTNWFYALKTWSDATSNSQSHVDPVWVRRVVRSLIEANPENDDLAEYGLALELACKSKDARKFAKALLKKRSSSLRLYNAYALIERRFGNQAAADHVWATSLSMSKSFPDRDRVDSIVVWRTWIWELLDAGNATQASHLLLSMPQNSINLKVFSDASSHPSFSPTNLLKIQSYLSEAQEIGLANEKPTVLTSCIDCLAILSYLSNSLDLIRPLDYYHNAFARLASLPDQSKSFASFTTELLHQSRARLLYHHMRTSGTYKPSHIRSLLSESISISRHNTMFLSLFAWNESRFRIEERVRDTIRDITSINTNADSLTAAPVPITTHLFSIYTELNRPTYAGSTMHSVRAAFEKAIGDTVHQGSNTSTGHSSITIWKLYILFELSRNDIQRAKNVFYRGMRACPWSKELIMLAFTHLRADVIREQYPQDSRKGDGMGFDELRHVYNVLVEKGLRIHLDIENELDEIAVEMERKRISSNSGLPIAMPEDKDSEDEMQR
ncbi:hypothetical protein ASPNIDRAFT_177749 [Aspergillus niger ATCC 1015]|uniref:DUF1740-domain-containing protein n=2 Tax=Aspergillus niger TaxID=5061 RepID=A0A505HTG0_ASPNG|nr:hypothetical protein ASPNIDRAFT_177749 [Aspergillus niger ATCC 1015]TPR02430.1 hypothetical protein CAN33_0044265 [Aspergillus niger]GLA46636.1 hypothetical protein AnigIFM63604_010720 [Aspergillus niger]